MKTPKNAPAFVVSSVYTTIRDGKARLNVRVSGIARTMQYQLSQRQLDALIDDLLAVRAVVGVTGPAAAK